MTKLLVKLIEAAGLPAPVPEHRFAPPRRWRFDLAWVERKVALEIEGGIFVAGRHSRGAGMLADMEKYNEATLRGWRVYRCTPEQATSGAVLALLTAEFQTVRS